MKNLLASGCSIASDGWEDRKKRPLINLLAVTNRGAKFLRAVDTTGTTKTATYIANLMIEAIEEIGPANVIQVGACVKLS